MSTAIFNGIGAITAVRFNNEVSTNFINNENKYAKLIKINKETVQFIGFMIKVIVLWVLKMNFII